MGNQDQKSLFYKARGFSGRLSEGFNFISDNLLTFLKSSLFLVLPLAILLAIGRMYVDNISGLTTEEMQQNPQYILYALPILLISLVGGVLFYALTLSFIQEKAEKGFIPAYKTKVWMKLMFKNSPKMIGYFMTVTLISLLLMGVMVLLGVLLKSLWVLLLFYLVLVIVLVPLALMPYIQVLENCSLFSSLGKSFKLGFIHWGSTFSILLLVLIFTGIVQFIVSLPVLITVAVDYAAKAGFVKGGEGLPVYYGVMKFILVVIYGVLNSWSFYIMFGPMAYQYSAIVTIQQEKEKRNEEL